MVLVGELYFTAQCYGMYDNDNMLWKTFVYYFKYCHKKIKCVSCIATGLCFKQITTLRLTHSQNKSVTVQINFFYHLSLL